MPIGQQATAKVAFARRPISRPSTLMLKPCRQTVWPATASTRLSEGYATRKVAAIGKEGCKRLRGHHDHEIIDHGPSSRLQPIEPDRHAARRVPNQLRSRPPRHREKERGCRTHHCDQRCQYAGHLKARLVPQSAHPRCSMQPIPLCVCCEELDGAECTRPRGSAWPAKRSQIQDRRSTSSYRGPPTL